MKKIQDSLKSEVGMCGIVWYCAVSWIKSCQASCRNDFWIRVFLSFMYSWFLMFLIGAYLLAITVWSRPVCHKKTGSVIETELPCVIPSNKGIYLVLDVTCVNTLNGMPPHATSQPLWQAHANFLWYCSTKNKKRLLCNVITCIYVHAVNKDCSFKQNDFKKRFR